MTELISSVEKYLYCFRFGVSTMQRLFLCHLSLPVAISVLFWQANTMLSIVVVIYKAQQIWIEFVWFLTAIENGSGFCPDLIGETV